MENNIRMLQWNVNFQKLTNGDLCVSLNNGMQMYCCKCSSKLDKYNMNDNVMEFRFMKKDGNMLFIKLFLRETLKIYYTDCEKVDYYDVFNLYCDGDCIFTIYKINV